MNNYLSLTKLTLTVSKVLSKTSQQNKYLTTTVTSQQNNAKWMKT